MKQRKSWLVTLIWTKIAHCRSYGQAGVLCYPSVTEDEMLVASADDYLHLLED